MSKKETFCVNHPDVVATDRCSQCSKDICYNCRIVFFGRLFCSAQCITAWMVQQGIRLIFLLFKALFWPLTRLRHLSWRGWLELLLAVGLFICFLFLRVLSRELKEIKSGFAQKQVEAAMDTLVQPPVLLNPSQDGMIQSNVLDIVGEVEPNHIVSLSINGKLIQAEIPQGKRFVFQNVRLHRGVNHLEVRAISDAGSVSTLQILTLEYGAPTLAYLAADLRRGPVSRKEVALTFDGGASNNAADEILDILKAKGVQSTFFLTGQFIKEYPETCRRISAEGHEVGNHTWTHPHLTTFEKNRKHQTSEGINESFLRNEFAKTSSLYKLITNQNMIGLWRAPYGEYNSEILLWAARAGYKHVGWTVGRGWEESMDTMDWVADKNSSSYHSSDEIVDKILRSGRNPAGANGSVILMHLGTNRTEDFPHQRIGDIIEGMRKLGYRFVKVSEMLE